ncbi:S-adenosyl-L-methionine-dependent methyltransferase [Xylariomycetidae sp. FL2044]|nr:S-adenosyl-L-methionine-dependent methyltransferase [Xylariomycetidae sp. FL2044]
MRIYSSRVISKHRNYFPNAYSTRPAICAGAGPGAGPGPGAGNWVKPLPLLKVANIATQSPRLRVPEVKFPMKMESTSRQGKRSFSQQGPRQHSKRKDKKAKKRERDMKSGSNEEILGFDVRALVESLKETDGKVNEDGESTVPDEEPLPEPESEIEVDVVELSSTGEALALQKGSKRVYVVPFSVPGDTVKVKVYRHLQDEPYSLADYISVVKPSEMRDDTRPQCQYFGKCSGCQFQMLEYAEQLKLKKRIVEKAFRNFSQLPPELIPTVQDTIGSPLQYGYRTKLTPHFDGPPGWYKGKNKKPFEKRPNVGFMQKGKPGTMDIEDCPIGTDAVRAGMKRERARMETEFTKYNRGATLLLRESTERIPKGQPPSPPKETEPDAVKVEADTFTDIKTCVTDNKGKSTEYIDDFVFHNPAGSFFQNNNSILPDFTDYIRQHILPPSASTTTTTTTPPIKYLIDAYSGSGLFTITLSSLFTSSTGIDIADSSIEYARTNARANRLPETQASFIAADARELFKSVQYDAEETVVVLDPPRKGCDANFLGQLLRFGPRRVVYVSCNVHTQARDVGMLVRGETGEEGGGGGSGETGGGGVKTTRYEIESLRGFDFFPQTGHVEGVAVLNRVEKSSG